MLLSKQ